MVVAKSEYVRQKDAMIHEFAEKVANHFGGEVKKRKDYKYVVSVNGEFLAELYLTSYSIRIELKELPPNAEDRVVKIHNSKRYNELGYRFFYEFPNDDFDGAYQFAIELKN